MIRRGARLIDLGAYEGLNMKENLTTFDKTKSVLDEMILTKKRQMQKPAKEINQIKEIDNIFKELWNKRQGFVNRN
jgi:hypothetical protein